MDAAIRSVRLQEITMYAITNCYDIKDLLKSAGAKWDGAGKAWLVSDELFAQLNARSPAYCNGWWAGWTKAGKRAIGNSGAAHLAYAQAPAAGVSKARAYDALINEGGEGYNPYRA